MFFFFFESVGVPGESPRVRKRKPGLGPFNHDLRRRYYKSGMKKNVKEFVCQCLMCQQVKAKHHGPAGLLQPLEVVEWKWEHIMIDFVTHFPRTSQGHDAVWVIVDRHTFRLCR